MPDIKIAGGASAPELKAYLARPPVGDGRWPGVVVLHEIFGLTDDLRQQTDRLAAAGYLAVAPDLYTAGVVRCMRSIFHTLSTGNGLPLEDIETVRRWLVDRPDCSGRIGVIGFCMGGGFALLLATRGFDVSAPNYGHPPKHPEEALRGACPIVGSYGRRDPSLKDATANLNQVLTKLDVVHDVKEYPRVGHSFMNRDVLPIGPLTRLLRIAYDHPSAEHAWGRILPFFDEHLRPA
jgi:carboxymethylenebutenolidase